MKPRYPMQPARREYRQMLKVALTPSPVARSEIQQRWRAFFEAAAQSRYHSDGPSRSPHQRRFHEVVAENMAAKRFAALQVREARVLRKCAHANDRVVPPIVAFGAMPPRNACSDQRAVQPP